MVSRELATCWLALYQVASLLLLAGKCSLVHNLAVIFTLFPCVATLYLCIIWHYSPAVCKASR